MYENEVIFTMDDENVNSVMIIKMDDIHYLKPSLYSSTLGRLSDVLGVAEEDWDIFDSTFISVLISMYLKRINVSVENFSSILLTIVSHELSILIEETPKVMEAIGEYLDIFINHMENKLGEYANDPTIDVIDVNVTYYNKKSLAYAVLCRVS